MSTPSRSALCSMSFRIWIGLISALGIAGCWASAEPPPESPETPSHLVEALQHQPTAAEILPTIVPRPQLVARATASTGQSMALYEYHPVPQPESFEMYVSLTFANDTLVAVGSRNRTLSASWLGRWIESLFAGPAYKDPYGPERVQDCVEALRESAYIQTDSHSGSSSRSC